MSDRLEVLLSLNVWGLSFVFLNKCFFKWTSHKGQLIDLQKTKDKTIVSKCFEKQTIALVQTKKNLPLIGFNEVSSSQISSTKLISAMT